MSSSRRDPQIELLLAAIPDIQGSIHANDAKSSAGLVVHGLLFAGVVSITAQVGDLWAHATHTARAVGVSALIAAAICFAISVWKLISAVQPSQPHIETATPSAFFPLPDVLAGKPEHTWPKRVVYYVFGPLACRWKDTGSKQLAAEQHRLDSVSNEVQLRAELASELVKLGVLRELLAGRATVGFRWLRVALASVAVYLALVALVAAGWFRVAPPEPPHLVWSVTTGGVTVAPTSLGRIRLAHPLRRISVRLGVREDNVRRVLLTVRGRVRCRVHGRVRHSRVGPITLKRRDAGGGELPLAVQLDPARRCRGGQVERMRLAIDGRVELRDALRRQRLIVLA